jgi:hypothetical protein
MRIRPTVVTARRLVLVGLAALAVAGCAAPAPTPSPTRLDISTFQVICGGVVPPPGEPFCRPATPTSQTIEVLSGRTVVASGTTGPDGTLLLDVPAGTLVVAHPDVQPWEDCDRPSVVAVAGRTTPVSQTCILNVP